MASEKRQIFSNLLFCISSSSLASIVFSVVILQDVHNIKINKQVTKFWPLQDVEYSMNVRRSQQLLSYHKPSSMCWETVRVTVLKCILHGFWVFYRNREIGMESLCQISSWQQGWNLKSAFYSFVTRTPSSQWMTSEMQVAAYFALKKCIFFVCTRLNILCSI